MVASMKGSFKSRQEQKDLIKQQGTTFVHKISVDISKSISYQINI